MEDIRYPKQLLDYQPSSSSSSMRRRSM